MSSCPKALGEGRCRWRHDQALKTVAEIVSLARTHSKHQGPPRECVIFVKVGKQLKQPPRALEGLHTTAQDWQPMVDLGRQPKFPSYITVTSLKPDIVIPSEATKQSLTLIELTMLLEDRVEEAFE